MKGRSPIDAKLFACATQTRRARERRVGMKGFRSTRWALIVLGGVVVEGHKMLRRPLAKWSAKYLFTNLDKLSVKVTRTVLRRLSARHTADGPGIPEAGGV